MGTDRVLATKHVLKNIVLGKLLLLFRHLHSDEGSDTDGIVLQFEQLLPLLFSNTLGFSLLFLHYLCKVFLEAIFIQKVLPHLHVLLGVEGYASLE